MTALVAALSAMSILGGALLVVVGACRTAVRPAPPSTVLLGARLRHLLIGDGGRFTARTRLLLAAGVAAGLVAWLVTGWVIAVFVLPAATVGLPALLLAPAGVTSIARLEAMEEWTRILAGVLTVGVGLEQALIATLRSTPAPIRAEVSTLVARLRARWTTQSALRAFADDLDDATGDLIASTLLLGAQRRGAGLAEVLDGLAQTVGEDVRIRRAIEADRAKPRATARWITLITIGVLALMALNGSYIAPYGTPFGQTVLVLLLSAYVAALIWMRKISQGNPLPRFIGHAVADNGGPA